MKLSSQSKPTMDFLWTLKNSFKRKPTFYWLDKSLSIKQQRLLFNAKTRSLPLFSRTFFWRGSSVRISNFAQHLDIQNPKCLLCQNEEEAYEDHEHFFFNCPALSPIRFGFLQALLSLFYNVSLQEFTQVKMSANSKSLIFPESLPATACLKTLLSACLNFQNWFFALLSKGSQGHSTILKSIEDLLGDKNHRVNLLFDFGIDEVNAHLLVNKPTVSIFDSLVLLKIEQNFAAKCLVMCLLLFQKLWDFRSQKYIDLMVLT
jgi:hypothetical protein